MPSTGYEAPWSDADDASRARQTRHREHATSHESAKSKPRPAHYGPRTCRICLDVVQPTFHDQSAELPGFIAKGPSVTYETEGFGRLFRPCLCKGTQEYVHEECLAAWRHTNPDNDTNYWQCPTCQYRYNITRMSWARWISSTSSQVVLTILIFIIAAFALGFVADPIMNLYFDPVSTLTEPSRPRYAEPTTWTEHFIKGLASLGLVGFAKFMITASPFTWFNTRHNGIFGGGRAGGNGRDRIQNIGWITLLIGIGAVTIAVWKGVRALCRRVLEDASGRVMEVPRPDNHDTDD